MMGKAGCKRLLWEVRLLKEGRVLEQVQKFFKNATKKSKHWTQSMSSLIDYIEGKWRKGVCVSF